MAQTITIAFDAITIGIGGILLLGDVIVEYFLDALTEEDKVRFNYVLGSSQGQQTWEALALLVSLLI